MLLAGPPPPVTAYASVAAWWSRQKWVAAESPSRVDEAIRGGFEADRLGYAFASGYQAALRALAPDLPADSIASLCATEQGGAHPKNIRASLADDGAGGFALDGEKRWATLSADAANLLVVASSGVAADGRNALRVVRVAASSPGVSIEVAPPAPFVPEITHAVIRFARVPVAAVDVRPGDGYERYLKPFRTLEDIHVLAAVLGYVLGVARRHAWPRAAIEEIVALLTSVRALGFEDAGEPAAHVALGGVFQLVKKSLMSFSEHWSRVPDEVRSNWERDAGVLEVASTARGLRLERAWESLASPRA